MTNYTFPQDRSICTTLRSKTRIDPISIAGNVSPNVTRSRGAGKIAINEIAARVAVTHCGNVELLLALETPMKERKAVNRIIRKHPRQIHMLGEVIRLPQNPAAVPLVVSHKPDLRSLVLS